MLRQILGHSSPSVSKLTSQAHSGTNKAFVAGDCEKILRNKRSLKFAEAMRCLDAGCHTETPQQIKSLIEMLQAEFPELTSGQLPIGIVSRCFLGDPYEVHTLDPVGEIIQHYKRHEALPPLLERARTLALHPSYAFIEVYTDCLRAISETGDVSVIKE